MLLTYERICKGGAEILSVSSASGTGKSQLIHEIHSHLAAPRAWFIEGKFVQFQKSTPYIAWIQAFKEFVSLLLTETAESLADWKHKILEAVGANAKLLTDLIPKIELVIGKQPAITNLEIAEAQSHFNHALQNFIKAIA